MSPARTSLKTVVSGSLSRPRPTGTLSSLRPRPTADYSREPGVRIALPMPPSANSMFVNIPGRGRAKSKKYKEWINTAGWLIKAQRVGRFTVPVRIRIELNPPRGLGFDLDNRVKAVLDLLKHVGVLVDDSARWVRGVEISLATSGAECLVTVEAVP